MKVLLYSSLHFLFLILALSCFALAIYCFIELVKDWDEDKKYPFERQMLPFKIFFVLMIFFISFLSFDSFLSLY